MWAKVTVGSFPVTLVPQELENNGAVFIIYKREASRGVVCWRITWETCGSRRASENVDQTWEKERVRKREREREWEKGTGARRYDFMRLNLTVDKQHLLNVRLMLFPLPSHSSLGVLCVLRLCSPRPDSGRPRCHNYVTEVMFLPNCYRFSHTVQFNRKFDWIWHLTFSLIMQRRKKTVSQLFLSPFFNQLRSDSYSQNRNYCKFGILCRPCRWKYQIS